MYKSRYFFFIKKCGVMFGPVQLFTIIGLSYYSVFTKLYIAIKKLRKMLVQLTLQIRKLTIDHIQIPT